MLAPMRTTLIALALLCPALAHAQGAGGVAQSGMGQGEARITSRADVRLSMESMPGTSGASVSALGSRVGQRMTQIRTCYTDIVAENPGVTGTVRLRMLLERRGAPNIEIDSDGTDNRGLVRCFQRALRGIDTARLRRPTHAIVQLVVGNTAAAGAERVERRARQAAQVQVQIDGDGNVTSNGGTPDGHVRFVVTGNGRDSAPAVVAAHRALLTGLPSLLDCRRRAGRRGHSSAGEIRATMRVREGRTPSSRVRRSTLRWERARGCVTRALNGIRRRSQGGSGRVGVVITYSEAEVIEGARD